jgi:GMP synthase-like glutamine amidotransferase
MRVHYFQHVPFENPGSIQQWAESHGHSSIITQFFHNDALPLVDNIDFLIILGGPMGVDDEKLFPWLAKEKVFISEAIKQKKKVLGICLGAQLIASALGAQVYPNPQKEIGWFPLKIFPGSESTILFKNIPRQFTAFHWHGDTFDLPAGAHLIAKSEACKHQAFSFGEHVLGLQFHLEVMQDNVEMLIQNCGTELREALYIQTVEQIRGTKKEYEIVNRHMRVILDQFSSSI